MFKTILFPSDGSALSDKAAVSVIEFAKLNQAQIVVVSVVQPFPFSPMGDGGIVMDIGVYEKQMRDAAQIGIDKIGAAAREAGLAFQSVITVSPSPYEEIVDAAAKFGCDIILMASHGRKGLNKLFVGSETQKVLGHTNLPVLVLR